MTKRTENMIMIHNTLIEGKNKLTTEELYVYAYLWTERTYEDIIKTSYDFISMDVKLLAVEQKNKSRVKKVVNSLEEKGLIVVEEEGKRLRICFIDLGKGYVFIPYYMINNLNHTDFFIYAAVAKWEKNDEGTAQKARYSYERWATLLGVHITTAITYIKKAKESGVIYVKEGNYIEANKQDLNTYSTTPFEGQEWVETVEEEQQPVAEPVVEEVKPEPVQEPVDVTTPPTLQELLPHVDLDAVKKELNPEPVKTSVPEFNNDGMFDIEAAMAAEGIDFNN